MKKKIFKGSFFFTLLMVLFIGSGVWGENLEIHYINVQQGQSILIIGPDGTTILLDGGNSGKGTDEVVPYLKAQGITSSRVLDYIIVTHLDEDHVGGLTEVINTGYDALSVYYNGSDRFEPFIEDFYWAVSSTTAGEVTPMSLGYTIDMGGASVTCLAVNGSVIGTGPVPGGQENENDRSIALLIQYGDFDYLVTGDMGGGDDDKACTGRSTTQVNLETPLVQSIMPGGAYPLLSSYGVEVVHVGHHGSESSTNSDFMNQLTPTVACISVGAGQGYNYHHPRKDVVEKVLMAQASCITAPPALVLQTEEGSPIGSNTSDSGYCVGDILITTDGVSTYSISASGAVSQGPDERSKAGLPETFNFDEDNGAGVIFSQVLYDSWVYYESQGEWIELYNPTSSPIDIGEWTIENTSSTYKISAGTFIGPGCYLVFADGQSAFTQKYGCSPHFSDLSLQLNNDGGYLKLRNSRGTLIDQVAWESGGSYISGWGSNSRPYANEGKSIVRSDLNQDTDTYADWMSNQNPDPGCHGIPRINLSTTQLSFEILEGETGSQTFSINNSGCGILNCTITDNRSWLDCNPKSGINSGTVTVTLDTDGLSPGTYSGKITVSDSNAVISSRSVTVNLKVIQNGGGGEPQMVLSRTNLYFGASGGVKTGSQSFIVSNAGTGTLNWTVTDNAGWLSCSPASGIDWGEVIVSVNSTGLAAGTYTGTISVSGANAANSPQGLSVTLMVYSSGTTSYPSGSFDTPIAGSTVSSSIPVTGWAVDDIEVVSVKIYNGPDFVGDAVFVEGARPDIEQAYPFYPKNYRAGWGYMLLTHFLPNGGNGSYTLYAKATDAEGNQVTLGSKTINIDNANAVKPFGAIDTPAQGGIASGSHFINWGWVLTPQPNQIPADGSTIHVYVDGVNLGHPTYNIYRSDIAGLFPGYVNSNGAAGYFSLDTTTYENGVHTIQWTAKDSEGNTDGIGSRYFTIQNTSDSTARTTRVRTYDQKPAAHITMPFFKIPVDYFQPVEIKKGYNQNINLDTIYPDDKGNISIRIKELERLVINLGAPSGHIRGYLKVGSQLRMLPTGSRLDTKKGLFYWLPGPGFIGNYEFVFVQNQYRHLIKRNITVDIVPRFQ